MFKSVIVGVRGSRSMNLSSKKRIQKNTLALSELSRQRAARLPAQIRRAAILDESAFFFAAHGFSASTRDLAESMGIRQALLYKYFESKEVLIESVFEEFVTHNWKPQYSSIISDRKLSLEDRLTSSLLGQFENKTNVGLLLGLRAVLDGRNFPFVFVNEIDASIINPLVEELRYKFDLPKLQVLPMMVGERELVLGLYGAIYFFLIREYVSGGEVSVNKDALIKVYVEAFLNGACGCLAALHNPAADFSLTRPHEVL